MANEFLIVGVDPGRTIGVAYLERVSGHVNAADYSDPIRCIRDLLLCESSGTVYVIERYYGGGLQSRDGEYTMHVAGYIQYRLLEDNRAVVMQSPQARKNKLPEAKTRLHLDKDRHKADALAHALAYRSKQERR